MDSVLVDPPSPDQLHSNFSQAANGAAQAIKHFTLLVEDSRIKEVMEKAKESRAKDGENITGWKVTEHENWLDVKHEDGNDDFDKEEEGAAEAGVVFRVEDVNTALDKLRSTHTGIEASLNEDSRTVKLHLPLPAQIDFQIQLNTTPEGHNRYDVDSEDKSTLQKSVLEAIRARSGPNDLSYLLVCLKITSTYPCHADQILKEMSASYVDIKSRPCVKCSRLLDRNAQFPVIRSRKRTKQPDGRFATQWQSFHMACT